MTTFHIAKLLTLTLFCVIVNETPKPRFELEYDLTAHDISVEYRRVQAQASGWKMKRTMPECSTVLGKHQKGAAQWQECTFASPFGPATDFVSDPLLEPRLSWAPIATVLNGSNVAEEWMRLADAAAIYDCMGAICSTIIHVVSKEDSKTDVEDILATCKTVSQTSMRAGAPWACSPLLLRTNEGGWQRILIGYTRVRRRTLGLPDFNFAVIGRHLPGLLEFLSSLRKGLTSEPLELATILQSPNLLLGTSTYKPSKVLEGYRPPLREIATVRVDGMRGTNQGLSYITITISTNLLVNSLATVRPEDWHLPSPAQEHDYVAAVMANLRRVLDSGCQTPKWRSDRVLTCGLSAEARLPAWVSVN